MCKVLLNEKLNGVELYFENKPAQEVINNLKENKFRWNRSKKCWYAKQNEQSLALANNLNEGSEVKASTTVSVKEDKFDLFDATRYSNIEKPESIIHDTKEIAKICRTKLKKLFPMVKFSVTSSRFTGGSEINCSVKESPFEADSIYLKVIMLYATKLINSYNYDNSDAMTDYFNVNFYFFDCKPDYDYKVVDNKKFDIEKIKADFDIKEVKRIEEKEAKREAEYQAYLKECEEKEKAYKKAEEERQEKVNNIENNVKVVELTEDKQYYIKDSYFANVNKNNTISEYQEEIKKGNYYLQDCKVTKEIYLNKSDFKNFENMLLTDFSFLEKTGGSYTDDSRINDMEDYNNMSINEKHTVKWDSYVVAVYCKNKLMFVIDAQGFSYARYVGLIGTDTKITKTIEYNQVLSKEEIKENTDKANGIINVVNSVIKDKDLNRIYNDSKDWYNTRNNIIEAIKSNNKHLDKSIIQQVKEVNCINYVIYKDMLYRCINEVNKVSDQAELLEKGYITIVKTSMLAGCSISHLQLEDINILSDDRVQLTGHVDGKRGTYAITIADSDDVMIYQGYKEIDKTVLYKVDGNAVITKYGSYDKNSLEAIIDYCYKQYNDYPVLNTYRTLI